jgi:uncharacterized SAM-binding protein YcdF (DUF218 family)
LRQRQDIVASRGRRRRRSAFRAAVAVVALLAGSTPVGPWLIREQALETPDAILVLGSHESERLPHVAMLARRWHDATVLLTQPVVVTPFNCQDCANRAATLGRAGVDPKRVRVLPHRVRNTFDELAAARDWLQASKATRLLVVTSPYHTRRVGGLAAAVLPDVAVGVSACPVPDGLAWPWWRRRYDRRYVIYELGALVNNSWRHGLSPRIWLAAMMLPRV